jgi:hypothetical protein
MPMEGIELGVRHRVQMLPQQRERHPVPRSVYEQTAVAPARPVTHSHRSGAHDQRPWPCVVPDDKRGQPLDGQAQELVPPKRV